MAGLNRRLFGAMVLTLFVAACTTQDDASSGGAVTDPSQAGQGSGAGVDRPGVSQGAFGDYEPGSQEELAALVGSRIYFGYDQYNLSEAAQAVLRNQADWLKRYGDKSIVIEGHCDERGTREYNLALGARRAAAARRYLMVLGIDGSRIRTISYGKERPEVAASNESAWSRNRRASTVIE